MRCSFRFSCSCNTSRFRVSRRTGIDICRYSRGGEAWVTVWSRFGYRFGILGLGYSFIKS